MDETALVISIVSLLMALLLAGFGTILQWLISKDTRQQGTEIRNDVASFKTEVSSLLGEIRGLTTETRQTQERQMDTMIHAITGQATVATATGAANIEQRIDAMEAALGDQHLPQEVQGEIRDLRRTVEALRYQIPAAMRTVRPVPDPFTEIVTVAVTPSMVPSGGSAAIKCIVNMKRPRRDLFLSCGVTTPRQTMFNLRTNVPLAPESSFVFRFPEEYAGADSIAAGDYIATVQLWDLASAEPVQRVDVGFMVT